MTTMTIKWIDHGREPQCAPNPDYPDGMDIDTAKHLGVPTCKADLPYPAKRCGVYLVGCEICGATTVVTTAGRRDDPKSILIPCRMSATKQ